MSKKKVRTKSVTDLVLDKIGARMHPDCLEDARQLDAHDICSDCRLIMIEALPELVI